MSDALQTKGQQASEGFRCRHTGCATPEVGDPMYRAPWRHGASDVCFDCWVDWWHETEEPRRLNGGEWTRRDQALLLRLRGMSSQDAAEAVGCCARTVRRWLEEFRRDPDTLPEWVLEMVHRRRQRRAIRVLSSGAGR
jgi:hypothetical protein